MDKEITEAKEFFEDYREYLLKVLAQLEQSSESVAGVALRADELEKKWSKIWEENPNNSNKIRVDTLIQEMDLVTRSKNEIKRAILTIKTSIKTFDDAFARLEKAQTDPLSFLPSLFKLPPVSGDGGEGTN